MAVGKRMLGGIIALVLVIPLVILPFVLIAMADDDNNRDVDSRFHLTQTRVNGQGLNNDDMLDSLDRVLGSMVPGLFEAVLPVLQDLVRDIAEDQLQQTVVPLVNQGQAELRALLENLLADLLADLPNMIWPMLFDLVAPLMMHEIDSDVVPGSGEDLPLGSLLVPLLYLLVSDEMNTNPVFAGLTGEARFNEIMRFVLTGAFDDYNFYTFVMREISGGIAGAIPGIAGLIGVSPASVLRDFDDIVNLWVIRPIMLRLWMLTPEWQLWETEFNLAHYENRLPVMTDAMGDFRMGIANAQFNAGREIDDFRLYNIPTIATMRTRFDTTAQEATFRASTDFENWEEWAEENLARFLMPTSLSNGPLGADVNGLQMFITWQNETNPQEASRLAPATASSVSQANTIAQVVRPAMFELWSRTEGFAQWVEDFESDVATQTNQGDHGVLALTRNTAIDIQDFDVFNWQHYILATAGNRGGLTTRLGQMFGTQRTAWVGSALHTDWNTWAATGTRIPNRQNGSLLEGAAHQTIHIGNLFQQWLETLTTAEREQVTMQPMVRNMITSNNWVMSGNNSANWRPNVLRSIEWVPLLWEDVNTATISSHALVADTSPYTGGNNNNANITQNGTEGVNWFDFMIWQDAESRRLNNILPEGDRQDTSEWNSMNAQLVWNRYVQNIVDTQFIVLFNSFGYQPQNLEQFLWSQQTVISDIGYTIPQLWSFYGGNFVRYGVVDITTNFLGFIAAGMLADINGPVFDLLMNEMIPPLTEGLGIELSDFIDIIDGIFGTGTGSYLRLANVLPVILDSGLLETFGLDVEDLIDLKDLAFLVTQLDNLLFDQQFFTGGDRHNLTGLLGLEIMQDLGLGELLGVDLEDLGEVLAMLDSFLNDGINQDVSIHRLLVIADEAGLLDMVLGMIDLDDLLGITIADEDLDRYLATLIALTAQLDGLLTGTIGYDFSIEEVLTIIFAIEEVLYGLEIVADFGITINTQAIVYLARQVDHILMGQIADCFRIEYVLESLVTIINPFEVVDVALTALLPIINSEFNFDLEQWVYNQTGMTIEEALELGEDVFNTVLGEILFVVRQFDHILFGEIGDDVQLVAAFEIIESWIAFFDEEFDMITFFADLLNSPAISRGEVVVLLEVLEGALRGENVSLLALLPMIETILGLDGEIIAELTEIADLIGEIFNDFLGGINIDTRNGNFLFDLGGLIDILAEDDEELVKLLEAIFGAIVFEIEDRDGEQHILIYMTDFEIPMGGATIPILADGLTLVEFLRYMGNIVTDELPDDLNIDLYLIISMFEISIIQENASTILFDITICLDILIEFVIDIMELDLGDLAIILDMFSFGTINLELVFEQAA